MPYININEYDYTITAPNTYSDNIVAVPINATDGPSDRWVPVSDYNVFVQTFGDNPNPSGSFGNSWEYAANLLLRGMTVLVRRITHELDEYGNNTSNLLPGVSVARTPIKIKNVMGDNTGKFIDKAIDVVDPYKLSSLYSSKYGEVNDNPNYYKNTTTISNGNTPEHFANIYDLEKQTVADLNSGATFSNDDINPSFAEVYNSNDKKTYQWVYTEEQDNPHYKGDATLKELVTLSQISYLQNGVEKAYVDGDFFIDENDSNHVIYYTPKNMANPYYVLDSTHGNKPFTNAFDLKELDINKKIVGNFVLVNDYITTNGGGDELIKITSDDKVWIYTSDIEQKTTVFNPLLVVDNGNRLNSKTQFNTAFAIITGTNGDGIDWNDYKWVRVYNNSNDLPSDVDNTSFAFVLENNVAKLYVYSSIFGWRKNENIDAKSVLTGNDSTYKAKVEIDFIRTDKALNEPFEEEINENLSIIKAYNEYIHFINLGEDRGVSTANSFVPYTKKIHWEIYNKNGVNVEMNSSVALPKQNVSGSNININTINIKTSLNYASTGIELQINQNNVENANIEIAKDLENSRLQSGTFKLVNNSNLDAIRIYEIVIQKLYNSTPDELYNAKLESINKNTLNPELKSNTGIKFKAADSSPMLKPAIQFDEQGRAYIELAPGESMLFDESLSNASFMFKIATMTERDMPEPSSNGSSYIDFYLFNSTDGYYKLTLSDVNGQSAELIKHYLNTNITINEIAENENYDDLAIDDGFGNFNIFKAEYLYPGTNGNALNIRIKNSANQGLYAYVYRNNQYLERLELCSYKTELNGRVKRLDLQNNKLDIWIKLLLNFGILLESDGTPMDITRSIISPTSAYDPCIQGKYVTLHFNKNLLVASELKDVKYIESLYRQNGEYVNYLKAHEGSNPDDDHVIHEVEKCFAPLEDKYRYDVKFISNGAYIDKIIYSSELTSLESSTNDVRPIEDAMLNVAIARADCIAFLDVPYDLPIEDVPYYFEHISSSYAAAYDPWGQVILETGSTKWMPPSFIQLYTHARSIQNGNKLYLPPAGVKRAMVPELLKVSHELPSTYITEWQSNDAAQYINPIIWINGYDYTIYGQKTLYHLVNSSSKYESALQDLNVRLVANEIKKLIFRTCISLTFELNNLMTWNEFKSKIEPTLSVMNGEGVLTSYSVIMGRETMTQADINSGHIVGTVRASIARAATDWDINFEITPNTVTFNEVDYNSTYTS